ncbi:autotransporter domain-containing protein, partial [Pseudovibrio axinellae]
GGPYTVEASVVGVAPTADFSLTNLTGAAASASVESGSEQSTQIGHQFSDPLVVIVRDTSNNPVPNARVVFQAPVHGASLTFASTGTNEETILTDTSGRAVSSNITANLVASPFVGGKLFSSYVVSAEISGIASIDFSLTNTRDSEADIARTKQVIATFVSNRADRIVSEQPNIVQRLRGGSFGEQKNVNGLSYDIMAHSQTASFKFSLAAFQNRLHQQQAASGNDAIQRFAYDFSPLSDSKTVQGSPGQTVPDPFMVAQSEEDSGKSDVSGLDFWAQGTYARANDNEYSSDNGLFFFGVDYRYKNSALFGLMAQLDISEETNRAAGTKVSGQGWMVGPYSVIRLKDNLLFDARATYGKSSNEVNALGLFEDSFETERFLLQAGLTGDFTIAELTVNPFARITYFHEQQKAYKDTLGNSIGNQNFNFGRLEFGPRVSFNFVSESGWHFAPFFSVSGIYDFEKPQTTIPGDDLLASWDDNMRARFEAGTKVSLPNRNFSLYSEGFYDGIGVSDYEVYGIKLNMMMTF